MGVQAAIVALRSTVESALIGLDVTVTDGPPYGPAETALAVSVGLGFNEEPPITLTDEPIGAGSHSDQTLVVRCIALSQASADADLTTVRASLIDAMERIGAAVAAEQTLGGAVARAWMGGVQRFWPARTNEAAVVTSAFDVYLTVLD